MKVLSLFDGISCARVALERAGFVVDKYYASEIDKYAIEIAQKNYPDTIQVGSVVGLDSSQFKDIELLIGGSPCQDLSIAKKNREGLSGQRSGLFYEYVRILNEVKPKYFVLENVNSMPKEAKEQISEILGVQPTMINAALVSAQNRKRLFWVGRLVGDKYEQVKIEQPEDRGIFLKDILENGESDRLKSHAIDASYYKGASWKTYKEKSKRQLIKVGQLNSGGQGDRIYSQEGKSVSLSANGGGRGAKTGLYAVARASVQKNAEQYDDGKTPALTSAMGMGGGNVPMLMEKETANKLKGKYIGDERQIIRKLTPIECERLQSLPDNYTEGVSNTQRYKALGNAFNVDVVTHILKNMEEECKT